MQYSATGPEVTVNSTYARNQRQSEITTLSDGRYIIVWTEADRDSTGGRFIRAQIYNADGTLDGGERTLAAGNNLGSGAIAALDDGGFALTWNNNGVDFARFDAAGTMIGSAIKLTHQTGYNMDIAVAADGLSVVWQQGYSDVGDTSGNSVWMRSYDFDSGIVSPVTLVNTQTQRNQGSPRVTALDNGGYLVVWNDVNGSWTARAQFFDAAGVKVGGELNLGRTNAVQPDVVQLADGNIVISWSDTEVRNFQYNSVTVARIFSPTFAQIGSDIVIPITFAGIREGPVVTALTNGGFAIAWVDLDQDLTGISVQAFDSSGVAISPPMRANTGHQLGGQSDPAIAALADGGFVVSWTDYATAGLDDVEVRAQRFELIPSLAIISDGGENSAARAVVENHLGVTVVVAQVDSAAAAVNYSIVGGSDASLFHIDAGTGALAFVEQPDFEAPSDTDGDNVYNVVVAATYGAATQTQAIAVTVANANETLALTSATEFTHFENSKNVTTVSATDADGDAIRYHITGGVDAHFFAIDAVTGALSFNSAPNFEGPADADANNIYQVQISASDAEFTDIQNLSIIVGDIFDGVAIKGSAANDTISPYVSVAGVRRATDNDDKIYGNGGHDQIRGGGGDDYIDGGAGSDQLYGDGGRDTLLGGAGSDRFVFTHIDDARVSTPDIILDFSQHQEDRIVLQSIDANIALVADQEFDFIGTAAFGHVAGQLRFDIINDKTVVSGDVDGDGIADFAIQLNGAFDLVAGDFIL